MGVLIDRPPELPFIIEALFENNITYIPIDPSFPQERVGYILADSQAQLVSTQSKHCGLCANTDMLLIDKMDDIASTPCTPLHGDTASSAYVIYTSGSSGTPKGVVIEKDAVNNFIEGMGEVIVFSANQRIACLTVQVPKSGQQGET